MTALEITKSLKTCRASILWINDERREAAFHPGGNVSACTPVSYNDATIAKGDPAFGVIDKTDGATYAAI
jgi:hypothetical protein